MFPVLAGNSASTGYNLTRSLRFRASASAYLNRTPASVGNQHTWTLNCWVKLGTTGNCGIYNTSSTGSSNTTLGQIYIYNNQLNIFQYTSSTTYTNLITTQVFRDYSAWYMITVAYDDTQATAANRIKVYVNGTQITAFGTATYPTQNFNGFFNGAQPTYFGKDAQASPLPYFDGYLTEVNFIDGQALTPSSFGSTNTLTGVWQPARYGGTYGTNGFYLPFTDNSALTTSSNVGLGKDFSGNGNYWTTNNISITAGVTYDSMTDVPTLTSATASNFAVLNPAAPLTQGLSNGNLNMTGTATVYSSGRGTIAFPPSTKTYWECAATAWAGGSSFQIGMVPITYGGGNAGVNYVGMQGGGNTYNMGGITSIGSFALNDVMGLAYDQAAGTLAIYKNNTLLGTISSVSTTLSFVPFLDCYTTTESGWINFGQRPFTYTPPTGYVALNTYNLPTSTILQGNKVMDATLYTGTLLSNAVNNSASFKPDLVWLKSRSAATDNELTDSVRGVTKSITSNSTAAEATDVQGLTAFNTNGFTVGTNTNYNNLAATYVAWQWQAGQGSTSSNTSGTITSTVSVNASAGFSIVTYTGNGTNGATVGHGLGVKPSLIIEKGRASTYNWVVQGCGVLWPTATQTLFLNSTSGLNAGSGVAAPTSSVFTPAATAYANESGLGYVAYCWTPIAGYSAFGSYTGNGSTDGPFVYTGFRPRFVMIKNAGATGDWTMIDTARDTYNAAITALYPNLSVSEGGGNVDILSNGFKIHNTTYQNGSGNTMIYAAFAENPFKNALAR